MESTIRTHTPDENPTQKLLAILAGVFAVLVIFGILLIRTRIPMPERVVFVAMVRGGTKLPSDIPNVWKRAIEHTIAPTLLGIAMENGRPNPFALTMHRITDPSLRVERSGLLAFVSDRELPRASSMTLGATFLLALRTLASPAYLIVDSHALDTRLLDQMRGPVNKLGVWTTDIRLPSKPYTELPPGDVALDLETFPEAWPILTAVSRDAGFPLTFEERPIRIGWTPASNSAPFVDLEWALPISTSTQLAIASAAGISIAVPYRLPDGVVVDELRLPHAFPTTSSILLTDRHIAMERIENALPARACRDGRPVFRLAHESLHQIFLLLGFDALSDFTTLEIAESGKRMHVCLR